MATKKPSKKATVEVTLQQIVQATLDNAPGYVHAPESEVAELVAQGLVEVNHEIKDSNDNPAVRATQKGIEQMASKQTKSATPATENKSAFAIEDGIEMPAVKRSGLGNELYPFDALQVGQSFFVPNSEDKPNAAKSLASTVSSATARYAQQDPNGATRVNRKGVEVPVMVNTRKFRVLAVEGGARVWRVA